MADPVRWFDDLGKCATCPKPATGVLRGLANAAFGRYCLKCAEKRLKKAKAERAREALKDEIPAHRVANTEQLIDPKE